MLLRLVIALYWLLLLGGSTSQMPMAGERPQRVAEREVADPPGVSVESWVENLEVPWSLVFLPDGHALVSERGGRILLLDGRIAARPEPYAELPARARGEGGLMGLALHPRFPAEPFLYAMLTRERGGRPENAVVRLRHEGAHGRLERDIIAGLPAAFVHNGGRIAFGPDGMLYIGAGEAGQPPLAQDKASLGGKVLRLTPDGAVPPDNPFPGSPVYSYGHRNVQGLAWLPGTRDLFASEHGPSGELGTRARDEINLVRAGGNYGWPLATCAAHQPGLIDPLVCWPEASVPPSGMSFRDGKLYLATLRTQALIRLEFAHDAGGYRATSIERWFPGRYGRLRDAVLGPDGALYVLTNNRDGRGTPRGGDDKILKLTFR